MRSVASDVAALIFANVSLACAVPFSTVSRTVCGAADIGAPAGLEDEVLVVVSMMAIILGACRGLPDATPCASGSVCDHGQRSHLWTPAQSIEALMWRLNAAAQYDRPKNRQPYDADAVVRHARELTAAGGPSRFARPGASLQKWRA